MVAEPLISLAGLVIGVLYGLFGVGSAFATPVLAILGVTGMAAVVGPLPALLPSSLTGALSYARRDQVDWWVAKRTIAAGFPAAIAGAVTSRWVGGPILVAASGVVLLFVGIRVLRPVVPGGGRPVWVHDHPGKLLLAAGTIGFSSGLLANGGGFLLVPLFLLSVGLPLNVATGTSLMVASTLTVPTLATHAVIGDIDWRVAGLFAIGLIPGSLVGATLSQRFSAATLRATFGKLLVGFAVWFIVKQAYALF